MSYTHKLPDLFSSMMGSCPFSHPPWHLSEQSLYFSPGPVLLLAAFETLAGSSLLASFRVSLSKVPFANADFLQVFPITVGYFEVITEGLSLNITRLSTGNPRVARRL